MQVLPRNATLNSDIYCQQLDQLRISIQQQRRRLVGANNQLYFLQDNARPHISRQSMQKIEEIGLQTITHPPYSPDLSPSDYYLFSPMKNAIRTIVYDDVDAIQQDLQNWFESKDKTFFRLLLISCRQDGSVA